MTFPVRDFPYASVSRNASVPPALSPAKKGDLDALEKIEHFASSVFSNDPFLFSSKGSSSQPKDWEFGDGSEREILPESPKMHCLRGRALAERQDASESENSEGKSTREKTDSSNGFSRRWATKNELRFAANSVNPKRSIKKVCEEYEKKGIRINQKTLAHRVKRLGLIPATKDQRKAAKEKALSHGSIREVCEDYRKEGIFVCYETLRNYVRRSGLAKATKAQLKAAKKEAASDKDIMKVCENYKKEGVFIDPRPLKDYVRRGLDDATEDQLEAAKEEAVLDKDLVAVCNKYAEKKIYIPWSALESHIKSREEKNRSSVPAAELSIAIEEAVSEAAGFEFTEG